MHHTEWTLFVGPAIERFAQELCQHRFPLHPSELKFTMFVLCSPPGMGLFKISRATVSCTGVGLMTSYVSHSLHTIIKLNRWLVSVFT